MSTFSKLKAKDLKRLCSLLGLNISGNKPTLLAQLSSIPTTPVTPARILSIDMGIRNLAYCIVDATTTPPTVEKWTRTAVPLFPTLTAVGAGAVSLRAYAEATHTLATSMLTDFGPLSHILIERQRWRSGGASSVLQWTIRVNTLEAMLHSALYTMQAAGRWSEGRFESVDPGRVARLWVPEREGRVTAAGTKMLKKEVVRQWIREGGVVELGNEGVEETAELLMLGNEPRGVLKKNGKVLVAEERKVDDVADCLLQAMAWIRWQENRRKLAEGGGVLPEHYDKVPATIRSKHGEIITDENDEEEEKEREVLAVSAVD